MSEFRQGIKRHPKNPIPSENTKFCGRCGRNNSDLTVSELCGECENATKEEEIGKLKTRISRMRAWFEANPATMNREEYAVWANERLSFMADNDGLTDRAWLANREALARAEGYRQALDEIDGHA